MKPKLRKVAALFAILMIHQVFSQDAAKVYKRTNRIAISADGNTQPDPNTPRPFPAADPDDWGATPVTLALLAKAGLQNKLVHYSYNNFIGSPDHTTFPNRMAQVVNGSISRWNYTDKSVFFDVPKGVNAARNHLAKEIGKSTASDPLFFILAGPPEFLYRTVQKVISDGKKAAFKHMYVISHSGYNETQLRRDNHHTWNDIQSLVQKETGAKIKFTKILEQNGCANPGRLLCSKTVKLDKNAKYVTSRFAPYHWMRDSKDQSLNWVYSILKWAGDGKKSRIDPEGPKDNTNPLLGLKDADTDKVNSAKGADVSDAGMIWYLLKDDELGNPTKIKNFIGASVVNSGNNNGGNNNGSTGAFPSGFFHISNKGTSDYIRPQTASFGSAIVSSPSSWKGAFTQWEAISANDGDFYHLRNKKTLGYLNSLNNDINGRLSIVEKTSERTKWKAVQKGSEFFLENKASKRRIRPTSGDDLAASTGSNFFTIQKPATASFEANFVRWNFVSVGSAKSINSKVVVPSHVIYPNPLALGQSLRIKASDANNYRIEISNMSGMALYEMNDAVGDTEVGGNVFSTSGIYFVKIISSSSKETFKINVL